MDRYTEILKKYRRRLVGEGLINALVRGCIARKKPVDAIRAQ